MTTRDEYLAMVLAAPGGLELMTRQFDTDEMVSMLRCTPTFLTRNLHELPHQKIGEKVRFDYIDFLVARDLHRVMPDAPREEVAAAPTTSIKKARSYKSLTPAPPVRRKR
ncbi:hypothetical protein [Streptomyces sp. NBC_01207]|uniref:hypothetical protein n=1 Tax=Streptomyces sp. NBC_01207 TaxID=2903772 RepID=UPI002E13178A|nr:hypothetical protein OG457_27095 [Streptomyces sp. NBC_01207]